jgi:hypothetical protein
MGEVGGCVDELVRWAPGSSVRLGWDGGSFGWWNEWQWAGVWESGVEVLLRIDAKDDG